MAFGGMTQGQPVFQAPYVHVMQLLHGSIVVAGDCADAALRYFLIIETKRTDTDRR
jgi:hypothetical protein